MADPDDPYRRPTEVPATVFIGHCTAAKIGQRTFLTAAHCVMDAEARTLLAGFERGAPLTIFHGVEVQTALAHELTVDETLVFPRYVERLLNAPEDEPLERCKAEAGDLALVRVREDSEIPRAVLDFQAIAVGDGILVGGYGREATLPGNIAEGDGRVDAFLSIRATRVSRLAEGTYGFDNVNDIFEQFALARGDSGGPVYRADAAAGDTEHVYRRLVGVNACGGLFASQMAPIDDSGRHGHGACLRAALERPADQPAPTHQGVPLMCARD